MGCCLSINQLENATFENCKLFELNFTTAKCIKVYDGDTIWIAFNHGENIYKTKARLSGIDTPELKPPLNTPNRKKIIESALKSKNKLSELIENKIITVKCDGADKYGRLLITIFHKDININEYMIEKKLAVKYDGGTKNIITI